MLSPRSDPISGFKSPLFVLVPVILTILLVTGGQPNLDLTLLSVGTLIVGVLLLWRPGEPPALLFGFALAWMGASTSIFHANWLGIAIGSYSPFPSDMWLAVVLSLFGLMGLSIGMRMGAGRIQPIHAIEARVAATSRSPNYWFRLYAVFSLASTFFGGAVWLIPSLSQVLLGFVQLKWVFFFILTFASILYGAGGMVYLLAAFAWELMLGIGGFFSDFKTVFLMTLMAAITTGTRFSPITYIGGGLLVAALLTLGVVWTSVKPEYRDYIAAGSDQQVAQVEWSARMIKLKELVEALDVVGMSKGLDDMLRRISYVEFFGAVLEFVPSHEPHTNGEILIDSIARPFMPRAFFPDKAVIDDTARTNQYTGRFNGDSSATSISIGYIGECYIDYGSNGMMLALFAIGYFYGRVYSKLLGAGAVTSLFGMGAASIYFLLPLNLDQSFTKAFGGLIANLLAFWIFSSYIVPSYLPVLVRRIRP
jgi:hypothetical protein